MIVKLVIKHVADYDERVLACKIHDYIENVLNHPDWFLKHQGPNFDYESECQETCEGEDD